LANTPSLTDVQIKNINRLKNATYLQFYTGTSGLEYVGTVDGYLKEFDKTAILSLIKANLSTDLTYAEIIATLGYTPYDAANPASYIALTAIFSSIAAITYSNITGVFSLTAGYYIPSTTDESNWNSAYTNEITSLTTTGSSGSASLAANVLNIPTYTLAGLGGISTISGIIAGGDLTGTYANPTIGTNKVTYAKFQQVAVVSLVGNPTGGIANIQEITLGSGLSFSGSTLVSTGTGGTVTSITSGNGMNFTTITSTGVVTMGTPSTLTVSTSNALTSTSHTHAITSSSAPGAAASILATDSSGIIGSTGTRIVKGWFIDLTVTNAITGSVTGNAGTVTNATFTTALTVNGGTLTLTANAANTSVLTIGAGAVSVSGVNTGDQTIVLTGNVTGSGTGSFPTTIANLAVTNAMIAAGTIDLTAKVTGLLPLANAGLNANLTASNGGIFYSTASAGAILAGTTTAGLALISGASTAPSWFTPTASKIIYSTTGGALATTANFGFDGTNFYQGVSSASAVHHLVLTKSGITFSSSYLGIGLRVAAYTLTGGAVPSGGASVLVANSFDAPTFAGTGSTGFTFNVFAADPIVSGYTSNNAFGIGANSIFAFNTIQTTGSIYAGSTFQFSVSSAGNISTSGSFAINSTKFAVTSNGLLSQVITAPQGASAVNYFSYTVPNLTSGSLIGVIDYEITQTIGTGSPSNIQIFRVNYSASGYTGSTSTIAGIFLNSSAGTSTNVGINGYSYGTTTGVNQGGLFQALNGNDNTGVRGEAVTSKNSAVNVGVKGLGLNGGTSPVQVGGLFALASTYVATVSAALIADNVAQSSPIALFMANGVTKAQFDINGCFALKSGSNQPSGTGTLVAGTVTISNSNVVASSKIFLSDTSSSTTNVGSLQISAKGTGTFTVTSVNSLDTSTFDYIIVNSF